MVRFVVFSLMIVLLWSPSLVMADGSEEKKGKKDSTSKTKEPAKKGPAKFVDSKHGISFLPPTGWIKIEPKNQMEDLLVIYAAPESFPNLNVQVVGNWVWPKQKGKNKSKKEKRTLEEFKYLIESFADDLKKRYANKLKIAPKVITTSGEGRFVIRVESRFTRQGKKGPMKQVTLQWIVFYKDLTVILTFTSSQKKYNQLRPLFLGTFDSLERVKATKK